MSRSSHIACKRGDQGSALVQLAYALARCVALLASKKARDRVVNAECTIVLHDGMLLVDLVLGPPVLLCMRSCAFDACSSLVARHFDAEHIKAYVLLTPIVLYVYRIKITNASEVPQI